MKYRNIDLSKVKESDRFQVICGTNTWDDKKYTKEICKRQQHGLYLGDITSVRMWREGCPHCILIKVQGIEQYIFGKYGKNKWALRRWGKN